MGRELRGDGGTRQSRSDSGREVQLANSCHGEESVGLMWLESGAGGHVTWSAD